MNEFEIKKLVTKAKERDADAFVLLMQHLSKDMYRTAFAILMNAEDAADAIQDTLLACWEKMDTLKEIRYYKTWITRILINKCYDIRKKRIDTVSLDECTILPTTDFNPDFGFDEVLSLLDEKYRLPMILFYGEGYKIKEIAKLMNLPQSTIQTRLSRGRAKLETYFRDRKE